LLKYSFQSLIANLTFNLKRWNDSPFTAFFQVFVESPLREKMAFHISAFEIGFRTLWCRDG